MRQPTEHAIRARARRKALGTIGFRWHARLGATIEVHLLRSYG
jgi:hypothetical protein